MTAYNTLFRWKSSEGLSALEIGFDDVIELIKKDLEQMRGNHFRWENIEVDTIQKRSEFISIFLKEFKEEELSILDLSMFESVLSLEYIDRITDVK